MYHAEQSNPKYFMQAASFIEHFHIFCFAVTGTLEESLEIMFISFIFCVDASVTIKDNLDMFGGELAIVRNRDFIGT